MRVDCLAPASASELAHLYAIRPQKQQKIVCQDDKTKFPLVDDGRQVFTAPGCSVCQGVQHARV
jgi:hypothetical protein